MPQLPQSFWPEYLTKVGNPKVACREVWRADKSRRAVRVSACPRSGPKNGRSGPDNRRDWIGWGSPYPVGPKTRPARHVATPNAHPVSVSALAARSWWCMPPGICRSPASGSSSIGCPGCPGRRIPSRSHSVEHHVLLRHAAGAGAPLLPDRLASGLDDGVDERRKVGSLPSEVIGIYGVMTLSQSTRPRPGGGMRSPTASSTGLSRRTLAGGFGAVGRGRKRSSPCLRARAIRLMTAPRLSPRVAPIRQRL